MEKSLNIKQLSAVHDKCKIITGEVNFWNYWQKCIGEHIHIYEGIKYTFRIHDNSFMEIIKEEPLIASKPY